MLGIFLYLLLGPQKHEARSICYIANPALLTRLAYSCARRSGLGNVTTIRMSGAALAMPYKVVYHARAPKRMVGSCREMTREPSP